MRFKIPSNSDIYNTVKARGIQKLLWDNEDDEQKQVLVYNMVPIPDRFYSIYVQAKDYDSLFVEFSIPKLLLDTNIFLIYPDQVEGALKLAQKHIENFFGIKVAPYLGWTVQRVDYDWAWKFEREGQAEWILENLFKYNYPRKDPTKKNTSMWFGGTTEKIEFYLKHNEFKDKGYPILKKKYENPELAEWLLEQSKKILRFEIVRRKQKLMNLFGEEVNFKKVIDEKYIIDTLNDTLRNLCNTDLLVSMNYYEAVERIFAKHGKSTGKTVFQYLNTYYNPDLAIRNFNRHVLKTKTDQSTIYRNNKLLREAGVNILIDNNNFEGFDLTIPGNNVINTREQYAEIAEAIGRLRKLTKAMGNTTEGKEGVKLSEADLTLTLPPDNFDFMEKPPFFQLPV